jgi:hypothetical protein
MTRFQYINTNLERIKIDVRIGIVSTYILGHFTAYSRFDYYRRQGYNKSDSIFCACQDMNVSESCMNVIKKKMEEEI